MKINIAGGTGVMGKVHGPIFAAAGHEVIISGRNTSPSLEEAAKQSDLTIVSVPIPATGEVIRRIAPYCSAIMDFTSLKKFPVDAMLKYSNENCEVGGLHPLYGDITSIRERTVVYCLTGRSGEKCNEIAKSFVKAGAGIVEMKPERHDYLMAIAQNARVKLLEAFFLLEKNAGNVYQIEDMSPPPARILNDLIARQADEKNDAIYASMQKYNPYSKFANEFLLKIFRGLCENPERNVSKEIREFYGAELEKAQKRAAKLIND